VSWKFLMPSQAQSQDLVIGASDSAIADVIGHRRNNPAGGDEEYMIDAARRADARHSSRECHRRLLVLIKF
jgi:hypothetical protein